MLLLSYLGLLSYRAFVVTRAEFMLWLCSRVTVALLHLMASAEGEGQEGSPECRMGVKRKASTIWIQKEKPKPKAQTKQML